MDEHHSDRQLKSGEKIVSCSDMSGSDKEEEDDDDGEDEDGFQYTDEENIKRAL